MDIEKHVRKHEKKVMDINHSYRRWYNLLRLKVLRMFEWTGLPFPQRELEMRLIDSGIVPFVKDDKLGYMVAWGSAHGVTQYSDVYTKVTYSAPTANGGTKDIGKDAVLCYANSLAFPIIDIVEKYASLLAHSDISIKCALINSRHTDILSATDSSSREDIIQWYNKMYNGDTYAILDKSLLGDSNINNLISSSIKVDLMELINTHNEILRSFYRDIGVRWTRQKNENMTEDELVNDDMMLLFNISDMLQCRLDFCEEVKKVFGLEISVKLAKEYNNMGVGEYDKDN